MDLNELFGGTFLEGLGEVGPFDIPEDVREGETVVGEMTPVEVKLKAFSHNAAEALKNLKSRRDTSDSRAEVKDIDKAGMALAARGKMASDLMWLLIRDRLGHKHDNIGVRRGCRVVSYEKEGVGIEDLLTSLAEAL